MIDELQQRVHVCSPVGGKGVGESGLEAGSLEPSAAPRHEADEISFLVRRM
jgi:hypothetical protein